MIKLGQDSICLLLHQVSPLEVFILSGTEVYYSTSSFLESTLYKIATLDDEKGTILAMDRMTKYQELLMLLGASVAYPGFYNCIPEPEGGARAP